MFVVYWDDNLVAMHSAMPLFCGTSKFSFRGHRLVVLPDFQGLGIGTRLNDFVGKFYVERGLKFFVRSTHIRLKEYFSKSKRWRETAMSNVLRKNINERNKSTKMKYDESRVAFSFEYVGEDYFNKEHKVLVVDDGFCPSPEYLLKLKREYYLTIATGHPCQENECEKLCKNLGIRTEMLYVNKSSVEKRNNKFDNAEVYEELQSVEYQEQSIFDLM